MHNCIHFLQAYGQYVPVSTRINSLKFKNSSTTSLNFFLSAKRKLSLLSNLRRQKTFFFVEGSDTGHLKVSFFGPFYGSYVIFELDSQNYEYAFVSGMNTDYLWLLSRTPQVSDELLDVFKTTAESYGFNIENLIMVQQPERSDLK